MTDIIIFLFYFGAFCGLDKYGMCYEMYEEYTVFLIQ